MSRRKLPCVHDCVHEAGLARYASYFEIGHNACEFLFDFGQLRPDRAEVAVHTHIVLGPIHAKLFLRMLQASVTQHEADHGPIPDLQDSAASRAPAPDSEPGAAGSAPEAPEHSRSEHRASDPNPLDIKASGYNATR